MSLLTALIVKNSHILAGIYFIFLKKRPRPNLKGFQYQTWTSKLVLSNKTSFSAFLQISCSNFETVLKTLVLQEFVKQIKVYRDNHSQNISDKL